RGGRRRPSLLAPGQADSGQQQQHQGQSGEAEGHDGHLGGAGSGPADRPILIICQ
ncbi:hypothetical protein HMPREF0731_0020, partial [Pseudoroseomonas cervicalis ATCC 49957]